MDENTIKQMMQEWVQAREKSRYLEEQIRREVLRLKRTVETSRAIAIHEGDGVEVHEKARWWD